MSLNVSAPKFFPENSLGFVYWLNKSFGLCSSTPCSRNSPFPFFESGREKCYENCKPVGSFVVCISSVRRFDCAWTTVTVSIEPNRRCHWLRASTEPKHCKNCASRCTEYSSGKILTDCVWDVGGGGGSGSILAVTAGLRPGVESGRPGSPQLKLHGLEPNLKSCKANQR